MSKYSTDVISSKTNAPKVTEIFSDANEQNTKTVVLYVKDTSDGYLYIDAAQTQNITRADLLNLCMKGLVLVLYKGAYHVPVYFKDDESEVTVTIATAVNASASASLDVKSKEPEAD